MWQINAVLMGVAEVKQPITLLQKKELENAAQRIFSAITGEEVADVDSQRVVGEVDTYYALQAVTIEENGKQCTVKTSKEIILQFLLTGVIYVNVIRGNQAMVMIITKSENFGLAAVVLQTMSPEDAQQVIENVGQILNIKQSANTNEMKINDCVRNGSGPKVGLIAKLGGILKPSLNSQEPRNSFDEASSDEDSLNETFVYPIDSFTSPKIVIPEQKVEGTDSDCQKIIRAEIDYIVETESRYCKTLQSLEEDRKNLTGKSPSFFKKWLSQIFRQIRPLTITHEELYKSMKESNYNIDNFCESFLNLKKQFHYYIFYIENIPTVDTLITEYRSYLQENCPALIEKLRQPRLRLHHYVLMLESLQKKFSESEKGKIQEVIDIFKTYLTEADTALLLNAVSDCPFHLSECGELVFKSDLKLVQSPDLQHRIYHVILFQRKLLILKGSRELLIYVHSIPVDEMTCDDRARGLYFSITVNRSEKGYSHCFKFKAKVIKLQQTWITKIRATIDALSMHLTRNRSTASFGRSGRRLTRVLTGGKQNRSVSYDNQSESDSEITESYWKKRCGHKKYKSFNSNRQNSEEKNEINGMAPLAVWDVFPELQTLYVSMRQSEVCIAIDENASDFDICEVERKYRICLNNMTTLIRKKVSEPPRDIQRTLTNLCKFHCNTFCNVDEPDFSLITFLKAMEENGEEFAVRYSEYLIDRCQFYEELAELDHLDQYRIPIDHFARICKLVSTLGNATDVPNELMKTAATILHDTITNANNCLLAENINHVPFALSQCEPILLLDRLKMRNDARGKQEYQVILLKDQIIILYIRSPLYSYYSSLRLDRVCLGPSMGNRHFQLEYRITATVKKTYAFWAKTSNVQEKWFKEIQRLLVEQAARLKEEHDRRLEVAPSYEIEPPKNSLLVPLHVIDRPVSPKVHKKLITTDL